MQRAFLKCILFFVCAALAGLDTAAADLVVPLPSVFYYTCETCGDGKELVMSRLILRMQDFTLSRSLPFVQVSE